MAAPLMELRHVPQGADGYVHRGQDNLVRLLPGSKLRDALTDAPFATDPDDNSTLCLPAHFIEFLYGRVVAPDGSMVNSTSPTTTSATAGDAKRK